MTSDEHTLLNHYNITTLYPAAWPSEKDESDASEDEQQASKPTGLSQSGSKSRYSALTRSISDRRSLVPGSEKTGDGVENLVQKDEPDPLGGSDSVVRILRQKGLPVEEDQRLRKGFGFKSNTSLLIHHRKPVPSVIDYLFAHSVLIPGPLRCLHPDTTKRS